MRQINNALRFFVILIFWVVILVLVIMVLGLAFGGSQVDGVSGFLIGLGVGITSLGFSLVGLLFAFSLICPLLEIAENTRVLRDAVESGDLKLTQSGQNKLPPQWTR